MACEQCQNVAIDGPSDRQQYVDPFSHEPAPRFYTCPNCYQTWWCTAEPPIGFWTLVADKETVRAIINGQPVMVGYLTTKI